MTPSNQSKDSHCYHCGLPNDTNTPYTAEVLGEPRQMCCPGCKAVAEAIVCNGLESYYQFRTEPAAKGNDQLDQTLAKLKIFDQAELQDEFVFEQGKHKQIQLTIEGISCAACGWLIEKQLAKCPGLMQVSVNVTARRAMLTWDPAQVKLSELLSQLENIGYHALPFQPDQHEASYRKEQKAYLKKLGLSGLMTMQVMMLAIGLYFSLFGYIEAQTKQFFHWISLLLTTPVVFYSGNVFYRGAYHALKSAKVNMDVPISIAIWGTYIAGALATWQGQGEVYFESVCMFIFLLLISRYLEHRSRYRASQISANMLQYIPVSATLITAEGYDNVLAKSLRPGQTILIKAGETIPADGIVIEGHGQVDESMLTGEFLPVTKGQADWVYGGTINHTGNLKVEVKNSLKYALVNQIMRMQEQALASKPTIAVLADKISSYFVSSVLLFALLTYVYWSWQGSDHAFWITISVLVATCPCALGLATPTALTCAMARLNRHGILLKRADALEQIVSINNIVFDKTGTLTEGQFSIQQRHINAGHDEQRLMQIAASLEACSEHPIAKAFATELALLPVADFTLIAGKGIRGNIAGTTYYMGNAAMIPLSVPASIAAANVILATDQSILAAFVLNDQIKTDAPALLEQLSCYQLTLLSGDNQISVDTIAKELQIKHAYANHSPQQKLERINNMQQQGAKVLMIGDGINDAPVLACADVSVAVTNASDLAKQSADVLLLSGKLASLKQLFLLAGLAKSKIRQNITWALGYNLLALPFAMSGLLSPWMAVIGMSLSSIIVVTNSVRLLK